ncbi:hypothetical protein [Ensifer sp. BR816]|uniref:hypothetical protein n=1 Tax=Rhizobium sp. (strain BR816) TaxID=1057002 RepID=UPI0012FB6530|nr:hypothetical protein [Ensifer sp. BR816]
MTFDERFGTQGGSPNAIIFKGLGAEPDSPFELARATSDDPESTSEQMLPCNSVESRIGSSFMESRAVPPTV